MHIYLILKQKVIALIPGRNRVNLLSNFITRLYKENLYMKKKSVWLVIIFVIIIGLILQSFLIPKNFENILDIDFKNVDKILMSSGTYGKTVEITDKDEIERFLNQFENIKVKKSFSKSRKDGYCLEARLFINDKQVGSFDYGYDRISIYKNDKETKYISNTNIDKDKINEIEINYNLRN